VRVCAAAAILNVPYRAICERSMSLHDFFVALVWISVTLLLLRAMWSVANGLFADDSFLLRVGHTIVLSWACIVTVAFLTAMGHELCVLTLLGTASFVAIVILCAPVLIRRLGSETLASNCKTRDHAPYDEDGFNPHDVDESTDTAPWAGLLWCAWAAWCVGRVVVSGLLEFPSNWDTLTYHLPLVDEWLRSKSLYAPQVMKWFFPGNNELLALWMVAPFSGDFFAPLNNCPSVVLLVVIGFHLMRLFGVTRPLAHLGALALVSNYVVSHQLLDNKNDVSVVCLTFAGLFYGLRYSLRERVADLMLASVTVGLLAGVKYYALGYSALVALIIVTFSFTGRGICPALFSGFALLFGFVIVGGYWYARNFWITSTPIYPQGLAPVSGEPATANLDLWHTTILGNSDPTRWYLLLDAIWRMTGPFHVSSLALLPTSLIWLCSAGSTVRSTPPTAIGRVRWALATATVGAAAVFAVTPFTIETAPGTLEMVRVGYVTTRLGFAFVSLTIVCTFVVANDWIRLTPPRRGTAREAGQASYLPREDSKVNGAAVPRRGNIVLLLGATHLLLFQTVRETRVEEFTIDHKLPGQLVPSLMVAITIVAGCALARSLTRRVPWVQRNQRRLLYILATTITSILAGVLGARWHSNYAQYYDAMLRTKAVSFLRDRYPHGARVCVLSARSFPFAGSHRESQLLQAHNYPAQPRRFTSSYALIGFMREYNVDIIVIPSDAEGLICQWSAEWERRFPDTFESIFRDDGCIVQRVTWSTRDVLSRSGQRERHADLAWPTAN
jgi:hypothetical protein